MAIVGFSCRVWLPSDQNALESGILDDLHFTWVMSGKAIKKLSAWKVTLLKKGWSDHRLFWRWVRDLWTAGHFDDWTRRENGHAESMKRNWLLQVLATWWNLVCCQWWAFFSTWIWHEWTGPCKGLERKFCPELWYLQVGDLLHVHLEKSQWDLTKLTSTPYHWKRPMLLLWRFC